MAHSHTGDNKNDDFTTITEKTFFQTDYEQLKIAIVDTRFSRKLCISKWSKAKSDPEYLPRKNFFMDRAEWEAVKRAQKDIDLIADLFIPSTQS